MNKLRLNYRYRIQAAISSLLDLLFAPVISRLTDEEYFSCHTRGECLRCYLTRATS